VADQVLHVDGAGGEGGGAERQGAVERLRLPATVMQPR
jgi:hypothetical protein